MSTLSLALVTIVVVVAVLVATRPAPRERRRVERAAGAEKNAPDPHSPPGRSPRLVATTGVDAAHRNVWDRHDLAFGIGRDDQASEPALLIWPRLVIAA